MKTNKIMRVASVLLVAVLLTTCAISGTFAKYVTTVGGNDTARVAVWGIDSDLTGISTFSAAYDTNTIKAANGTDLIVAPGASDSGVYSLKGTPETAYQVTFNFEAVKDVFLKANTYAYTSAADVEVANDYNPIQWTVTLATTNGTVLTGGLVSGANNYDDLAAVAAAIDATKIDFAANETCDVSITIAWDWAFESGNDGADTVLGDIAANNADLDKTALVADTDYCLTVSYNLTLTATQVNTPE